MLEEMVIDIILITYLSYYYNFTFNFIYPSELKRSLVDEFYAKLEVEISKYSTDEQKEEKKVSSSQKKEVTKNEYDEDMEKNIIKQLSEFNNPFLLKALEEYLPSELLKKSDTDDAEVPQIQNIKMEINIFKR